MGFFKSLTGFGDLIAEYKRISRVSFEAGAGR